MIYEVIYVILDENLIVHRKMTQKELTMLLQNETIELVSVNENKPAYRRKKEGGIMGKYGKCDFKELEELKDKIEKLGDKKTEFMESCAKELAARLLRGASNKTPTGIYPPGSGKVGGTLKRAWTTGEIQHIGNVYKIEIINPVEYASYVEYGHRKRNHKGWVEGKFMMTISEQEIQTIAPKVLENKIKKLLGDVMK